MIPEARLADVGTDHAYLPVWLLQNGRIPSHRLRCAGGPFLQGPLRPACGCFERMSFRLCDGLLESLRRRWTLWSSPGWGGRLSLISSGSGAAGKGKRLPLIILQPRALRRSCGAGCGAMDFYAYGEKQFLKWKPFTAYFWRTGRRGPIMTPAEEWAGASTRGWGSDLPEACC